LFFPDQFLVVSFRPRRLVKERQMDNFIAFERRVARSRQIVARQRGLVAKFGEQIPIAVALLETFERSLALHEETLAAFQRDRALTVRAEEQIVRNSKALLPTPIPNCLKPADATGPALDYQAKSLAVAHIMGILREGGYDCELAQEVLHS
jgi:hypothetical protein